MAPTDSTSPSSSPGPGFVPPTPEELDALLPSFDVTARIGMGGMGAVYSGMQNRLERPVAVKVMPADVGVEYDFPVRFEREAKAMAQLSHNNIVGVIDFGELHREDGSVLLCFIMEYVEGSDLHQLIRAGLKPAQAYKIIAQICEALDYAHENGIVHRDIKPANILIDKTGRVKVADFGLAKVEAGPGATSAVSSVALGTPDYAAPEVFEMAGGADHRADIYSLGVLIYEALTGRVPRGRFEPPSKLNPELDARLDKVVEKAMAQDQGQRYQRASEVSQALVDAQKGPKLVMGSTSRVAAAAAPKLATARHQPVGSNAGQETPPVAQPVGVQPVGVSQPKRGNAAAIWMVGSGVLAMVVTLLIVFLGGEDNDNGDGDGDNGGGENPIVANPDPPKPPDHPVRPDEPIEVPSIPDKPDTTTGAVDLLVHVDPWKSEGLESIDGAIRTAANSAVLAEYDPEAIAVDGAYVFDMVVSSKVPNGFRVSLPVAGRRIHVPIDLASKEIADGNRLMELFYKFEGSQNPTRVEYSGEELKVGVEKAHRVVIFASPGKIIAEVDGKELLHWEGKIGDLEIEWGPEVNGVSARGKPVVEFYGEYAVHRMEALPPKVKTASVDLGAYVFPEGDGMPKPVNPESGEEGWVDALAAIDLERDGVMGNWKRNDDGSIENVPGEVAKLVFPFPRVGSYEVEVKLELLDGAYGSNINFSMGASNSGTVTFGNADNKKGDGIFLEGVKREVGEEGRVPRRNIGTKTPTLLLIRMFALADKRVKIETRVDGEPHVMWEGDRERVVGNPNNREFELLPEGRVAGIGFWSAPRGSSHYRIHSIRYKDLTKPVEPPVVVTPDPPKPPEPDDKVAVRLAELEASFKAKVAVDVEKAHSDALKTLDGQFAGALKRAEDEAAKAGKLDDVVLIRKEAERVAAGDGVPDADAAGTPALLVDLRKTYRAQVAKLEGEKADRAKPLFDLYVKALSDYEVELTRAKAIEDALRVKAYREEVAKKGAEMAAEGEGAVLSPGAGVGGPSFEEKRAGEEMENAMGMKFCWIPAGKFTMGSPEGEEGRMPEREAQVEVELTRGFWMGKYEVTQGEYEEVIGSNPATFKDVGKRAPVEMVSWEEAMAFCAKVTVSERKSGKLPEGWAYTLPTEAQWEYACRAGEKGSYSGGALDEVGWYQGNSGGKSHEVGQKKANASGLHDMHGNVREWCADWYADKLPGGIDPTGPDNGSDRVHRGAAWNNNTSQCRAANRSGRRPSYRDNSHGFRVCLRSMVLEKEGGSGGVEKGSVSFLPIPKRPTVAGKLEVYRRDGKPVGSPSEPNALSELPDDLGSNVVAVSVGQNRNDQYVAACALLADGTARIWGAQAGTSWITEKTPQRPSLERIVRISAGWNGFLFIDEAGRTFRIWSSDNLRKPVMQEDTVPTAMIGANRGGDVNQILTDGSLVFGGKPRTVPGADQVTAMTVETFAVLGRDGNWRLEMKGKPGEFWEFESRGLRGEPVGGGGKLVWLDELGTPHGKTTEGEDFSLPGWNRIRNARQVVGGVHFYGFEVEPGVWEFFDEDFNLETTLEKKVRGCTSVAVSAHYVFGIRPER